VLAAVPWNACKKAVGSQVLRAYMERGKAVTGRQAWPGTAKAEGGVMQAGGVRLLPGRRQVEKREGKGDSSPMGRQAHGVGSGVHGVVWGRVTLHEMVLESQPACPPPSCSLVAHHTAESRAAPSFFSSFLLLLLSSPSPALLQGPFYVQQTPWTWYGIFLLHYVRAPWQRASHCMSWNVPSTAA